MCVKGFLPLCLVSIRFVWAMAPSGLLFHRPLFPFARDWDPPLLEVLATLPWGCVSAVHSVITPRPNLQALPTGKTSAWVGLGREQCFPSLSFAVFPPGLRPSPWLVGALLSLPACLLRGVALPRFAFLVSRVCVACVSFPWAGPSCLHLLHFSHSSACSGLGFRNSLCVCDLGLPSVALCLACLFSHSSLCVRFSYLGSTSCFIICHDYAYLCACTY